MKSNKADKNFKKQWEQQLQDVEHTIANDDETPESVKGMLSEWLNHGEDNYEPKVYAEVLTGIIHSEEDHIKAGHSEEDCYDLKV
tara:strand:- start:119 stop:373 length:255 start_codon:yes stop_codon:yes gene_type:complete